MLQHKAIPQDVLSAIEKLKELCQENNIKMLAGFISYVKNDKGKIIETYETHKTFGMTMLDAAQIMFVTSGATYEQMTNKLNDVLKD